MGLERRDLGGLLCRLLPAVPWSYRLIGALACPLFVHLFINSRLWGPFFNNWTPALKKNMLSLGEITRLHYLHMYVCVCFNTFIMQEEKRFITVQVTRGGVIRKALPGGETCVGQGMRPALRRSL